MRADPKEIKRLINTVKGQLDGISGMIDENRYCIDIFNQVSASIAILKKVNQKIIKAHLEGCVRETVTEDGGKKIAEIVSLMEKLG